MPDTKIVQLGAGQGVGRSCILLTIGGKNIMLDCWMHMGFQRQGDFQTFCTSPDQGNSQNIWTVSSSATFMWTTAGPCLTCRRWSAMMPIYMTHPTKAICPILLEDYRKITVDRKGETNFFTSGGLRLDDGGRGTESIPVGHQFHIFCCMLQAAAFREWAQLLLIQGRGFSSALGSGFTSAYSVGGTTGCNIASGYVTDRLVVRVIVKPL